MEFRAYVGGQWRTTAETRTIRSPFDGAEVATVSFCGPDKIEAALVAAIRAAPLAAELGAWQRAAICRAIGAGLGRRAEEIADGMCAESGKPIGEARAEVERAMHTFEIAAAESERIYGEVIPMDLRPSAAGRWGLTRRFPIGVVVGITPFNFPLNLAVHKIAPAIAAGCPIIVKPAEQTPLSCLRLAEIIDGTDWPKGALSVLPAGREVSQSLVTDERPKLLSFTGSQRVGWQLKAQAGKKKVVLELGGNAAVLVDESADLDDAIPKLIYGAFSYAGQKCISVQRIYVHQRRFAEFLDRFAAASREVEVGDPKNPTRFCGPMIDEANARRVESWIEEARAAGARVVVGGVRRGAVLPPTVLTGVPPDCRLQREEAFGPTVNVESVASFAEGLSAINDSAYGLQCGVFTRDLAHTLHAFERLVVGAVIVNDAPSFRIDHMPYGGVKESGLGREGVRAAIAEMTEERLLVIAPPQD
jgi:acyl-CoA reductase-like NAD-dependent aldehyde dehydrogenase